MKRFMVTLTVLLDIEAENQEEVQDLIPEMDYEFIDPRHEHQDLSIGISDFKISEVEN